MYEKKKETSHKFKKRWKFLLIFLVLVCVFSFSSQYAMQAKAATYTMQEIDGVWRHLTNGSVDYSYTGMDENEHGWWYFENVTSADDVKNIVESTTFTTGSGTYKVSFDCAVVCEIPGRAIDYTADGLSYFNFVQYTGNCLSGANQYRRVMYNPNNNTTYLYWAAATASC